MSELLSIREAQRKMIAAARAPSAVSCPVKKAYARVLIADVHSPMNLPPFTNSSMDGFAVHNQDILTASETNPVSLPVKMDIPAGASIEYNLPEGVTARILTGAPLPQGADAVVPVENTDQFDLAQSESLPDNVKIFRTVKLGENIRRAGEDVHQGQLVLKQGRSLQPQDVGLLVSLGIRQVSVARKARIALFSSGDELLTPDEPMSPGKIYDSNRYVLTGLLEAAGAEVIQLGIARDTRQSVIDALDQALHDAPDLIVSSAGVSVGVYDFVQQVISENGALSFWKVNMRPGKPIAFGNYKGIPFLGLPGNPVSAYVGCTVFALPFVRHLHGLPPFARKTIKVVLTQPLESPDGRESYYRGIVKREGGVLKAALTGHQGSGNLFSLVRANALLIVPAGVKMIPAGEEISVWTLEGGLDEEEPGNGEMK